MKRDKFLLVLSKVPYTKNRKKIPFRKFASSSIIAKRIQRLILFGTRLLIYEKIYRKKWKSELESLSWGTPWNFWLDFTFLIDFFTTMKIYFQQGSCFIILWKEISNSLINVKIIEKILILSKRKDLKIKRKFLGKDIFVYN